MITVNGKKINNPLLEAVLLLTILPLIAVIIGFVVLVILPFVAIILLFCVPVIAVAVLVALIAKGKK